MVQPARMMTFSMHPKTAVTGRLRAWSTPAEPAIPVTTGTLRSSLPLTVLLKLSGNQMRIWMRPIPTMIYSVLLTAVSGGLFQDCSTSTAR